MRRFSLLFPVPCGTSSNDPLSSRGVCHANLDSPSGLQNRLCSFSGLRVPNFFRSPPQGGSLFQDVPRSFSGRLSRFGQLIAGGIDLQCCRGRIPFHRGEIGAHRIVWEVVVGMTAEQRPESGGHFGSAAHFKSLEQLVRLILDFRVEFHYPILIPLFGKWCGFPRQTPSFGRLVARKAAILVFQSAAARAGVVPSRFEHLPPCLRDRRPVDEPFSASRNPKILEPLFDPMAGRLRASRAHWCSGRLAQTPCGLRAVSC